MVSGNDFVTIVGDAHVREADGMDAVDGIPPQLVVSPGSVEEVAAVLSLADRSSLRVAPRGSGTLLGIGNPPRGVDVVLDMRRLDRVLEHAVGDLVVSVEAGVRAGELSRTLGSAGQILALDIPDGNATIGGAIATNVSGPRRFRYGTVRDLLIGVTIVLADGTIARAGGKVVKNVAGYDLAKLMTGSLGTLGVIVKANFRLHPLPAERRFVALELDGAEAIAPAVQRILHSGIVPSAVQLRWESGGAPRLGVLFEGIAPSVEAQAAAVRGLVGTGGSVSSEADGGAGAWEDFVAPPSADGEVVIRVTCPPIQLSDTAALIARASRRIRQGVHIGGAAGVGVLEAHLSGADPKSVAEVLGEIRSTLKRGHAVVVAAPLEVKRMVDVWGPVGSSLELMKRVKERFDPNATLNPGRFVGGI